MHEFEVQPNMKTVCRIAYIVHSFEMGGLERCVARLVNHLDRDSFWPMVICLNRSGDAASWIARDDVRIVELHKRRGNDPRVIFRLARELKKHQVDLVHSHNWGTLLESAVARRLVGVPLHIHAERGMEIEDCRVGGLRALLRGYATYWAINRADELIAVSKSVRDHLIRRCRRPVEGINVIPNGIDPIVVKDRESTRRKVRAAARIPDNAFVVGSVGRLARVKDFRVAIDVVGVLRHQGRDVHLVLVGDGPEKQDLVSHAAARGLEEYVHCVGQQMEVGRWLAAMDLYLNVSLNEGMSQSILEAMSTGLPLVVTDVGANAELAGGDSACGIVVGPRDHEAVARAVNELLLDEGRRHRFGEEAVRRFENSYGIEQMIHCYEQLYARHRRHSVEELTMTTSFFAKSHCKTEGLP